MYCPQCGHRISGRALFCPNCGRKLQNGETHPLVEPTPSADPFGVEARPASVPETKATPPTPNHRGATVQPRRRGWLSLVVVLVAVLVMILIAGIGVAAIYVGLNDRAKVERSAAEEHYQKGLAHLDKGELELAIAEFELTVQLNPNLREAQTKLQEARERLQAQPTATPALGQETKQAYLEALRSASVARNWPQVFDAADRLLALDPAYERAEVDQILFDAFYQAGLEAVQNDQLAEGIRLFDRALALHPEDVTIQRAKYLASLYQAALSHWGSDWAQAVQYLDALYLQAPDYKDVSARVYQAHVTYGDQLVADGQWCRAAEQYQRALELQASDAVSGALQQANASCQSGSPAPGGTGEGEAPLVGPSGSYVGRLAQVENIGGTSIFVRGTVLDEAGEPVAGLRVQIGAWDWKAVAVTDGAGQYSFDGLGDPVTYTLTLLDVPSLPFDVACKSGKLSWVDFRQVP